MNSNSFFKINFIVFSILLLFLLASCAQKKQKGYIFSWQFGEESKLKPRGGTSKGAPVKLAPGANKGWLSIQEEGISQFEKDRRAILSMAGTYRTSFNFIETAALRENYSIDRPYRSWATEYIEVLEDKGDFISLQHILVMYFLDKDGKKNGPFISKHWRQDWKFEDKILLEFKGRSTWEKRVLSNSESKGKWTQAVYQVDDSPRYESIGKWKHDGNYSEWTGTSTWRPLPRREFSARSDYDVLSGINIHIITPDGWIHEQHNLKLDLEEDGSPVEHNPYIARELGINRYEKINPDGYTGGKEYLDTTDDFWKIVRNKWNEVISKNRSFRLRKKYKDKRLFEYLFTYAEGIGKNGNLDKEAATTFVDGIIENFVNRKIKNNYQKEDGY